MCTMNSTSWRARNWYERQKYLLDTGHLSDCNFIVGENKAVFKCHKLILSQVSEIFESMFYGKLKIKSNKIILSDIEGKYFKNVLQFIYTDEVDLTDAETAIRICLIARRYCIEKLNLICCNFLMEKITEKSFCDVCEFFELINYTEGQNYLEKYMENNAEDILNSMMIINAKEATLLKILQHNILLIKSELSLIFACINWVKHHISINDENKAHDEKELRIIIHPFLKYIRFRSLKYEEFTKFVLPTKILSIEEEKSILSSLISNVEINTELNLCNEIKPRYSDILWSENIHLEIPIDLKLNCIDNGGSVKIAANKIIQIMGFYLEVHKYTQPASRYQPSYTEIIQVLVKNKNNDTIEKCTLQRNFTKKCMYYISLKNPYILFKYDYLTIDISYTSGYLYFICVPEQTKTETVLNSRVTFTFDSKHTHVAKLDFRITY